MSEDRPTVIIDTREQAPLPFGRLQTVRGTLKTGDYSLAGAETDFAVERKSLNDLACCVGPERARFMDQLARLKNYQFKRLLIVGRPVEVRTGRYRGSVSAKTIFGTLASFEIRFDVPVVWAHIPELGGQLVERWAWYWWREFGNLAQPARPTARGVYLDS